jgi:low affinity Fe/Cu permease
VIRRGYGDVNKFSSWFATFAREVEAWTGSPIAFILAILTVVVWAATGPFFGWSDSHSLFINTLTTIITYLMVFCLQSAQLRDTRAIQLKLDELIRANQDARNELIDIEDAEDAKLSDIKRDLAEGR